MIPNSQLLHPLESVPAIGVKRAAFFKRLVNGAMVFHVLSLLPSNILRRQYVAELSSRYADQLITFAFRVGGHYPNHRRGSPYKISGQVMNGANATDVLDLVFFNPYAGFLKRVAPEGAIIIVSGKLTYKQFGKEWQYQMSHPDHMGPMETLDQWVGVERVYPLTAGLTQGIVRAAMNPICDSLVDPPEWIDGAIVAAQHFLSWRDSIQAAHNPKTLFDLSPLALPRQRLAYDELFAKQLATYYFFEKTKKQHIATAFVPTSRLLDQFFAQLPFELTQVQRKAIAEIAVDMAQTTPMHRLLQGDVGSGKTLVALAAALIAIENGHQAALMAPTDILARQHLATVEKFLAGLGVTACVLTGREKGKARAQILQGIASNTIQLIIGTHAIFQNDVVYSNLALAVIDEQHRFGVKQRLELASKSANTHVLSMTATPIPRTLLLANYGEMTVSQLREKPPGRKDIETRTVSLSRLDEIIAFVKTRMDQNEKVFWVCPLVEESEKMDLAAATQRFAALQDLFGDTVVLTHGKQKSVDKEEAFRRFSGTEAKLLVSTTVIEVGVDVPEATVMIIEHAERFGLAQLHQLRGRIGRGALDGVCLLLFSEQLSHVAKQRLLMMKKSSDGFELAEEDLRLRGGGDTLGLKQSGLPSFRFADLSSEDPEIYQRYQTLYELADRDAKALIQRDPNLTSERGWAAQMLLQYFALDEAERLKKAG